MNNEISLNEIIDKAQKLGGYFITATLLDRQKDENNLSHYVFQQEFPRDDIMPSLDMALRSMNVRPSPPPPQKLMMPEVTNSEKKPLRIGILTHFNRAPDSYSPGQAVKAQIKTLQKYGHEVVLFTQEGATLEFGCEKRCVVPKFKREKNIVNQEIKQKFIDILRTELTSYDVIITHDIMYIDDCITYREAIKECGVPVKWLHWARSGVGKPIDLKMPNAKYVYMNYTDVGRFAEMINVSPETVRVVFNEKDPAKEFSWHPITVQLNDKYKLFLKDIVQTYPMCSTRMDAKGINHVIRTFGALKKLGNEVILVICNSNGRKRVDEIKSKLNFAYECGLDDNDIVFTSLFSEETAAEVPHKVVTDLMNISNLFIFPTTAEVCSNVLLEASLSKNLLVLNKDFPSLYDFADENSVLGAYFGSRISINYKDRDENSYESLARQIDGQLKSNKADRQFRQVFRVHNAETIYNDMLVPILYE